jgi:PAS domain S-box-containing protein
VALLLACAAIVVYDLASDRRATVSELSTSARIIGTNSTAAIHFDDPAAAEETLAALRAEQDVVFACIYAADGTPFAQYRRDDQGAGFTPPPLTGVGYHFESDHLDLFDAIRLNNETIGTVYIRYDLAGMRARLIRYLTIIAGVALTALAAAFVLSSRLQRVISRPVLRLAETARLVSTKKDFSVRAANETQRRDEIGVLIDGFNEMLSQVQQRDGELKRHRDSLEEQVSARTAELSQANHQLRRNAEELARALDQVALQRQIAEDANRLMSNILSSVSTIIIAVDRNERVTQWNAAAEQLLNIPIERALGTPLGQCMIPWDNAETIEAIVAGCQSNKPVRLDEIRFIRPDSTTGLLSLVICPMNDEHGEHGGAVLLGEDVTERSVMQHELQRAQKLESVGALAAGIAHEINTPIQFVGDNTRFLSDSFEHLQHVLDTYRELKHAVETQGAAAEAVERVGHAEQEADIAYLKDEIPKAIEQTLEGIERVATIVRAMKDFSHPDKGEKVLADINQALESTLTVARNELKYVADVVTDFDRNLPPMPCYLGDLNQVFLNLLINAAHAIGDVVGDGRAGRGTITVTTRREADEAVIRIADTGTGIPEAIRDRIFDPFFTTKTVGKGTGQGLAIAHSAVAEKHGGTLTFETEVGKGTTFIVRLPI